MRANLRAAFASAPNIILTLVALLGAGAVLIPFARWSLIDARWSGTATDCRGPGVGACWAFIGHKLPFILFGLYPAAERWRPALATALLLAVVVASLVPHCWRRSLMLAWIVALVGFLWLMGGGLLLSRVPTQDWGGFPVTAMLTVIGLALGFPLGVLLALGRRSHYAVPRLTSSAIVEVVRGVPLVAVLYLAVLVVPLALSSGVEIDKLVLAQGGIAVFAGAYLAEAVRAGLQMVPARRADAARALGLTWWQTTRLVVLPESLRVVAPSFVSIAVGFFQDTSLIVIIGLFDLLNTARLAAQDPDWLGFHTEAYVFIGAVYFAISALVSRYGLWIERRLGASARRM
ncbi:MAG TPA: amino acid ABC transporter permease [Gemmatimonadaceae bacterium]|nr:amino acid ABC transporter permease [Gemmatimonadaceae bacterium]